MQEAIKKRPKIPLTDIIFIDGGRLLDLIEKLRSNLPEEIQKAKWITKERDEIMSKARVNADKMISEAKEEAIYRISESVLVQDAQSEAKEIISRARKEEINIIKGADEYADEILSRMEEDLNGFTTIIQKARQRLKKSSLSSVSENYEQNKDEASFFEDNIPEEELATQETPEEEYEEEYEEEEYEEEEYEEEYEEEDEEDEEEEYEEDEEEEEK